MAEKLDVIIFGASGFTGKYTVYEATSVLKNLRWGIAGRSRDKLQAVLKEMGAKAKVDLMGTPIIIADVGNETSLLEMARRCKVVVNCCGPYRFIGEPVVRACIEAGTHHVDVSGESQYMESMQLKYHAQAQERNVYVVSACGFDSIPSDMGIAFIEQNFDGTVNSVETYLKSYRKGGRSGGAAIHYGTWESAIHSLSHMNELHEIRSKLYKDKLPKFTPTLKQRPLMFRSEIVKGVCLPFPGPDVGVMRRSQRFLFEQDKKRPIQVNAYLTLGSWLAAVFVVIFAVFMAIMMKFSAGRALLLKYPKLFTMGFVSHEGPTEETMARAQYALTMKAMGWPKTERLAESSDQFKDPPTKSLTVKVSGTNPGYGTTCVALLCTAVTILKESDKMPGVGGVLPPGAAFAKTNLITELGKHERGIKFEILESK